MRKRFSQPKSSNAFMESAASGGSQRWKPRDPRWLIPFPVLSVPGAGRVKRRKVQGQGQKSDPQEKKKIPVEKGTKKKGQGQKRDQRDSTGTNHTHW